MPNNLPLAVAIADTASQTPMVDVGETLAKAEVLTARHPEADVSVQDVAEILREESIDQIAAASPEIGAADLTSDGGA